MNQPDPNQDSTKDSNKSEDATSDNKETSAEGLRARNDFTPDEKAYRAANRASSDVAHNTHPGHPGEHAAREETGRHTPRTP